MNADDPNRTAHTPRPESADNSSPLTDPSIRTCGPAAPVATSDGPKPTSDPNQPALGLCPHEEPRAGETTSIPAEAGAQPGSGGLAPDGTVVRPTTPRPAGTIVPSVTEVVKRAARSTVEVQLTIWPKLPASAISSSGTSNSS